MKEDRQVRRNGPIYQAFGSSKDSFLILPRTVLMDMPTKWQKKMVELVDELDEATGWKDEVHVKLTVTARDKGEFAKISEWLINYKCPGEDMYRYELEPFIMDTRDTPEKTHITWIQRLKTWWDSFIQRYKHTSS